MHSYLAQYRSSLPDPITPTIPTSVSAESDVYTQAWRSQSRTTYWTAPIRDGLPTPPNDMTSVVYNSVPSSSSGDESSRLPVYSFKGAPCNSDPNIDLVPAVTSRKVKPSKHVLDSVPTTDSDSQKKDSSLSIAPYLQVPATINNGKGSLAEFAAQMTCLFWFEETPMLKAIEECMNPALSLGLELIPSVGFQKWVTTILSTTQVSKNVILLALLLIYRLKKFNPKVRGKKGSEFRLMTIALMLSNKYLDDNTYTNTTWAEVSGISVQEIHVMEIEFLSNVRYNLFVSKEEWTNWHYKLGLFAEYSDKASRITLDSELIERPPVLSSPVLEPPFQPPSTSSKLPSPPASSGLHGTRHLGVPSNGSSHLVPAIPAGETVSRKRVRESTPETQTVKRLANVWNAVSNPASMGPSSGFPSLPILGNVPTSRSTTPLPSTTGSIAYLPQPKPVSATMAPAPVSYFPTPVSRHAVSSYNPVSSWLQQLPTTPAAPTAVAPVLYNNPLPGQELNRQTVNSFSAPSTGVSPAVSAHSIHTPQKHLSPSFFLTQRSSPYRPVRGVNTLLIPPPFGAVMQPRNVSFDNMHYRTLSKDATETKTGLLPYLHPNAWASRQYMLPVHRQDQTPFN